jgi:hypothetical protein
MNDEPLYHVECVTDEHTTGCVWEFTNRDDAHAFANRHRLRHPGPLSYAVVRYLPDGLLTVPGATVTEVLA